MVTFSPDEKLRQKFLILIDNEPGVMPLAHHIFNMVHTETIVNWLLSRGLRGKILYDWWQTKFKGSILAPIEFIVADVNRAPKRPIRVGKDYARKK